MSTSTSILRETDKLPALIYELALYPQDKWVEQTIGKTEDITGHNLILHKIYREIEELRWLRETTTYLFCRTERYREIQRNRGGALAEFAYIPIPGLNNGKRVKHALELEGKGGMARILTDAPELRSRELAWKLPYKTSTGEKSLIMIFTFDPLAEISIRTTNQEWERCIKYWKNCVEKQGLLAPGEKVSYLHAFTGLHEWMGIVDANDGEKTQVAWKRHYISPAEAGHGANRGLDIYYSNSIVAYAWSTLEKQKGRDRARAMLQQDLCKRVVLYDPIYGKIQGVKTDKREEAINFLLPGDTEREKIAKSFWDNTIGTAYSTGASDIHIEPMQVVGRAGCDLIVSLRKDAQLNFHTRVPSEIAPDFTRFALETSGIIKEELKRPQDGRRGWVDPVSKDAIDLRISVTPVGAPIQKIVMRLLDTNKLKRGISDIGLEPDEVRLWEKALALNQSLVLVSGPTNSGKSTTLYAALLTIYQRDTRRSFATIEDPVEYRLPFRSTQSPVNEEKGASYERLIRQAMRNDGDTFLIGEIRDTPTANAALQLSLTGHQVLSSIHANSATETVLRLLELGVDPYILSETLKMVVAQRLIPTSCPHCKLLVHDSEVGQLLRKYGGEILLESYGPLWERKYKKKAGWIKSEGCPACNFTGLAGMTAAQEFMVVDHKNRKFVKEGNIEKLEDAMKEKSHLKMEEVVWKFAWQGRIPMEQAGELTNQLKSG
jgi:type II secretory ATPase GspE/PulE/Tfp pilus assembly ATPase PilB-like protein